jgi:predicted dinucleotide-binding enzyme
MTTAVIGIGRLGGMLARQLVGGRERVVVAARNSSDAAEFAKELGGLARAGSVSGAIADADAVVLALMWQTATNLIPEYAELLDGKVVIDPTNPLAVDETGTPVQHDGKLARNLPEGISTGEVIAGLLPVGAHYAKAFGTLIAADLSSDAHRTPERVALLYATDDDHAASTLERLITAAGFDPVKAGGVADCGRIESPGGDLTANGSAFQGQAPTAAQALAAAHAARAIRSRAPGDPRATNRRSRTTDPIT